MVNLFQDARAIAQRALYNLNPAHPVPVNIRTGQPQPQPHKIVYNVSPLSLSGGVAAAGRIVRGAYSGAKAAIQSVQRLSFKQKVIGGTGIVAASQLGGYYTTGEFQPPSLRTFAGVAAYTINPIAALAGGIGYPIKKLFKFAEEKYDKKFNDEHNFSLGIPDTPIETLYNILPDVPDYSFNFPGNANSSVPSLSLPSINISGGGGGGDLTPLIFALLAGGGLGYLAGKKRRKKRYKKRRKH